MAVPIRFQNIPEYLHAPRCPDQHALPSDAKHTEPQNILQFPKSTCVLWDGTSTGPAVCLHIAQYRKPKLQLLEKVLWLLHKQVGNDGLGSKVLVGSLSVEDDFEGVSFHIERLETRQTNSNSSLLPDDVLIPVQVLCSGTQDRGGSREDYAEAIKTLQKRVCSCDALELNSLLLVKGWCSMRTHERADRTVAHLQFDVVTLSTVFKATPVNPVPIIPVALAKHLSGPRNFSHVQGRPKMGYLSMDATRKLLLVLESDPKVASLPVVGIWVSGVPMVTHPFVWASCLRYLHNERLQDRVCVPPEGFLLVLYTSLHSKPEFYELGTTSGKPDLDFDLYTGFEVTTLDKKSSGIESGIMEWELSPVRNGPKREMFDAALEEIKSHRQDTSTSSVNPVLSVSEDIIPRMTPAPHQSKAVVIKPMVPEVSMLWNDDACPALQPFSISHSQPTCLNTAFTSTPAPFSASTAPLSSQGVTPVTCVPSFVNRHSVSKNVFPDSSASNGYSLAGGQQSSECMPRIGFPARHPHPQTVYDQNNSARTRVSSVAPVPSSGCLSAAYSRSIPQPVQQHPASSQSQHLYNNGNVLPHSNHCPPQVHPQPQMFHPAAHENFPPQSRSVPHPTVRMATPAGQHYCQPIQTGPNDPPSDCFPHPAHRFQRPQYSNAVAQLPSNHGQPSHGGLAMISHRHTHNVQPWTGQPTVQMSQPSVGPQISQGRQANNLNFCQTSAQSNVSYPCEIIPLAQRTVTGSQGQMWPPHRNFEGSGPHNYPVVNDQARSHAPSPPNTHPLPMNSYAQFSGDKFSSMQPSYARQAHPHAASCAPTIPETVKQLGSGPENDSHHANSTSSSTKSSDDSGLSITPDHSNPSPKTPVSPGSKTGEGSSTVSLENMNLDGVPSQVVQLLVQQAVQLKELQAQIQQLLAQQQSQAAAPSSANDAVTPTPTPSSDLSTPPSIVKREMCSTAVNTTLMEPASPQKGPSSCRQCVSIQTSPQQPATPHFYQVQQIQPQPVHQQVYLNKESLVSPFHHHPTPKTKDDLRAASEPHTPCRPGMESHGETSSDMRHQGPVQLNSTKHDDPTRATSVHSSESLGQPSSVRSMESHLQLSHSTPSPQSASMCIQADEGEEANAEEGISPDSKEYYDQLINNIRLFLNNHDQDMENIEANQTDPVPGEQVSAALKLFDSTLPSSPSQHAGPSNPSSSSSNTTMMPHINYLSMMLGSDSDTSLEINAMAMKYLRDEQLTQVARHHHSPSARGGSNHQLLRQVLAASLDATGVSDVSRLGISANNLSMATKKYMEKYGLLNGGHSDSILDANQTIRLQTDFSLAAMSESRSALSQPSSPTKPAVPQLGAGTHSPVKREVLQPAFIPSPTITEERDNSCRESNRMQVLGDLGASPALHPRYRGQHNHSEDTPIFPERYRNPQGQGLVGDCSLAMDDDRILDIEKLKQMPKLL